MYFGGNLKIKRKVSPVIIQSSSNSFLSAVKKEISHFSLISTWFELMFSVRWFEFSNRADKLIGHLSCPHVFLLRQKSRSYIIMFSFVSDPCQGSGCKDRPYSLGCQNIDGKAVCICPMHCPETPSYVCGSDGFQYESECMLKRSSCLLNKTISVAYTGECSKLTSLINTIRDR